MEREEFDKIKAMSERLDQTLHRALHAHLAIDRRLKNFHRQKNIVQKELFHQRFRSPKKTIEITHPFPLKYPVQKDDVAPTPVSESSLENERQVDALMTLMAKYNQTVVEDAPMAAIDEPDVSESLAQPTQGQASRQMTGHVPEPSEPTEDGVSLSGEFVDDSLYIQGNATQDVSRAKDAANTEPSLPDSEKEFPPMSHEARRSRIWDYIDEDKKSGGISHDL